MQPRAKVNMFAIVLLLVCVVLSSIGQICLKKGMNQLSPISSSSDLLNLDTIFSMVWNVYVLSGILIYIISAFLWLAALTTLDVSFLYPMLSLAYVVTAIFACAFLGESISFVRWIAIGLVVAGCIFMARS